MLCDNLTKTITQVNFDCFAVWIVHLKSASLQINMLFTLNVSGKVITKNVLQNTSRLGMLLQKTRFYVFCLLDFLKSMERFGFLNGLK